MSLRLGIDIGTSGVRTAVLAEDGTVLSMARAAHLPQVPDQIDAEKWWVSVQDCLLLQMDALKSVGCDASEISGIAVDGTSGTMVLTDGDLTPVTRALMYNSKGFDVEADRIAALAPDPHITRGSASALGRAMRLVREDTEQQSLHLLHQADFIAAKLMGQAGGSDHNNALKTGYDPETGAWPEWMDRTGVPVNLLPKVHSVGTEMGPIANDVSTQFGFDASTIVHAGTTDSIAAFLACAPLQEGVAVTSLGTTLAIKMLSPHRIDAPEIGLYSHRVGNHWLVGGASNTGGGVLLDHFTTEQIQALSGAIDPSAPCELNYYPLSRPGERFPINDSAYEGNLMPRPSDDTAFLEGLLHGIAQVETSCYAEMERLGAGRPSTIYTAGGGAQNAVWTAIRRRKLGIDIQMAENAEACIGVARLIPS